MNDRKSGRFLMTLFCNINFRYYPITIITVITSATGIVMIQLHLLPTLNFQKLLKLNSRVQYF